MRPLALLRELMQSFLSYFIASFQLVDSILNVFSCFSLCGQGSLTTFHLRDWTFGNSHVLGHNLITLILRTYAIHLESEEAGLQHAWRCRCALLPVHRPYGIHLYIYGTRTERQFG